MSGVSDDGLFVFVKYKMNIRDPRLCSQRE